jgi:hypothetical protein
MTPPRITPQMALLAIAVLFVTRQLIGTLDIRRHSVAENLKISQKTPKRGRQNVK